MNTSAVTEWSSSHFKEEEEEEGRARALMCAIMNSALSS